MSLKRHPGAKSKFKPEDDEKLKNLVIVNGTKNWNMIATQFEDKSPKQCRDRWFNYLDPSKEHGNWRIEEEIILMNCIMMYGTSWNKISYHLPKRTPNDIRIHFLKFKRRFTKCLRFSRVAGGRKKNIINIQRPVLPIIQQYNKPKHDTLIEEVFGKHEKEILDNFQDLIMNDYNDELVARK